MTGPRPSPPDSPPEVQYGLAHDIAVQPGGLLADILGAGTVGANAAQIAVGMGAKTTLIDVNLNRLRELDDQPGERRRIKIVVAPGGVAHAAVHRKARGPAAHS